jgi:hypothetical protein
MLQHASKHVRNCYARAADCRLRAESAVDAEARAFWREEEARWLKLAESEDLSARLSVFLESSEAGTFSPEAEEGVATLVRVFNRVCAALHLDLSDEALPSKVARTIIVSAIEGESDPEVLYQRAMRAALH